MQIKWALQKGRCFCFFFGLEGDRKVCESGVDKPAHAILNVSMFLTWW